jgi:hypothetical protein
MMKTGLAAVVAILSLVLAPNALAGGIFEDDLDREEIRELMLDSRFDRDRFFDREDGLRPFIGRDRLFGPPFGRPFIARDRLFGPPFGRPFLFGGLGRDALILEQLLLEELIEDAIEDAIEDRFERR